MPDLRKINGGNGRARPPADNFANSRRRIDDLPSDNGQLVDTLAGGLLRAYARSERLDQAVGRLNRRLTALGEPRRGDLLSPLAQPPGRSEPR